MISFNPFYRLTGGFTIAVIGKALSWRRVPWACTKGVRVRGKGPPPMKRDAPGRTAKAVKLIRQ